MDKEKEVKRYERDHEGNLGESKNGDLLYYEDHAKALSAERDRADRSEQVIKKLLSDREQGELVFIEQREKIEVLESKLKEAEIRANRCQKHYTEEYVQNKMDTIIRLEAKVKELDRFIEDLSFGRQDASLSQIYFYKKCSIERLQENKDLESQLATANAKIVELEKNLSKLKAEHWFDGNNYQCKACKCFVTGRDCTHSLADTGDHYSECPECGANETAMGEDEMSYEEMMPRANETIKGLQAELSTANTKAEKLILELERIKAGWDAIPRAEQAIKEFRGGV